VKASLSLEDLHESRDVLSPQSSIITFREIQSIVTDLCNHHHEPQSWVWAVPHGGRKGDRTDVVRGLGGAAPENRLRRHPGRIQIEQRCGACVGNVESGE
jgi:hypothetical protein